MMPAHTRRPGREADVLTLAACAAALVFGVWIVSGFVFALQAVSCRLEGAASGRQTAYHVPGGCFVRDAGGTWARLPVEAQP